MDKCSAGEVGVCGDHGLVSSLEPAVRAEEIGGGVGVSWVFVASDGMFFELSLGLGVTDKGEVGVINEETEDAVLILDKDGGDEPKLIKARLAPKPGSRSGPESGGVWVTGKPVVEKGAV